MQKTTKQILIDNIVEFYAKKEDKEHEQKYLTVTLKKLYPIWLESKMKHTNSTTYIKRINTDWNAFYKDDEIADKPLQELTTAYLDDWIHDKIKTNHMTKTKYYNMSIILRQCLDHVWMELIFYLQIRLIKSILIKNSSSKNKNQNVRHRYS